MSGEGMSDDLWRASRQKSGCRRPAIAIGGLEPRQYQFALLSGRDSRRVVWTADWVRELDALGSYPLAMTLKLSRMNAATPMDRPGPR